VRCFAPEVEDHIPTPLGRAEPSAAIPIESVPPAGRFHFLSAFRQLTAYGLILLKLRLTGKLDPARKAVLTRELFERLSGIWIKAGQLLSLRTDLMSDEMCRELAKLQYRVAGFPPETARRVVEDHFGRPLTQVFSDFEPLPFAAASICQVHRATLLRNGRAVVVKVRRPDVRARFARDMRVLRYLCALMGMLGVGTQFRMAEGVRALDDLLNEETDYRYEAVNLKRMRRSLRPHGVHVPRVFKELSGEQVLVMEEVPGVLMSNYIEMRRTDPSRLRRWQVENGIEPEALARRLTLSVLRQILEDNLFHGDLHPGNIMLLADNGIALLDFGSVGRLDERTFQLYRRSLAAISASDFERAADYMLLLQPGLGAIDPRPISHDLRASLMNWETSTQFPGARYADRSVASMSNHVAGVFAQRGVPFSWSLMRVGRSLSTLDASLQTLAPKGDFRAFSQAYFRDRQHRSAQPGARRRAGAKILSEIGWLMGDINLALGGALRHQSLRAQGMLDTPGRLKLAVLSVLQRGVNTLIILTLAATILDEKLRGVPLTDSGGVLSVLHQAVHAVHEYLPNLHLLTWFIMLSCALFVAHILRVARSVFSNRGK
jgi:ubiquinone biosynthesis protein